MSIQRHLILSVSSVERDSRVRKKRFHMPRRRVILHLDKYLQRKMIKERFDLDGFRRWEYQKKEHSRS